LEGEREEKKVFLLSRERANYSPEALPKLNNVRKKKGEHERQQTFKNCSTPYVKVGGFTQQKKAFEGKPGKKQKHKNCFLN